MTGLRLFDPGPADTIDEPVKLSATRRLTARNQARLDQGIHPATGLPLAGNGHTCADCAHHVTHVRNRAWHKCDIHRLGQSHSAASDIRVGWPACRLWKP